MDLLSLLEGSHAFMCDSLPLFSGLAARLEEIDRTLLAGATDRWRAEVASIPSLLPREMMVELGYERNFAGHVTLAHPIASVEQTRVLSPAACLGLFPGLSGSWSGENTCYTARVKVFRYEEGHRDRTRLWEFHVRELVFVGDEAYVRQSLQESLMWSQRILLGLHVRTAVLPASDYFTGDNRRMHILKSLQRAEEVKHELLFRQGTASFAVASVNYHGRHFAENFAWGRRGKVVSGCVGFGLERCLIASLEGSQGQ